MNSKWKIYYENGNTYGDKDGSHKDAPFFGVIGVVCDSDEWHSVDFAGLLDYLQQVGIVKLGRLTSNKTYHEVMNKARKDLDFSPDRCVYEGEDYYVWMGAINDD